MLPGGKKREGETKRDWPAIRQANFAIRIKMSTTERDRGELWEEPAIQVNEHTHIPSSFFEQTPPNELVPTSYKERRKFSRSCICERLSELNLRTTRVGFGAAALAIAVGHRGMCLNGLQQVSGTSIVQEEQPLAQTPERSGAELIRTGRSLVNPIRQTRSHVMDRKVGEGMICDVRHGGGFRHARSKSRGMAESATHTVKQVGAIRSSKSSCWPAWGSRRRMKAAKFTRSEDISASVPVGLPPSLIIFVASSGEPL